MPLRALRLLISFLMVVGLGTASFVHASGPCVPQMQSHALSPTVLSDCGKGFLRTEHGKIPCGKMRAGCFSVASCFSNVGLAAPEIGLTLQDRSECNLGTMRQPLLTGISVTPLLRPPASIS